MSTTTYHPKGSMCARCKFKHRDCSSLAFDSMRVIEQYKSGDYVFKTVKCTEFSKC